MRFSENRLTQALAGWRFFVAGIVLAGLSCAFVAAQTSDSSAQDQGQNSSSAAGIPANDAGAANQQPAPMIREQAPSLVDPNGPTISLVSSEQVFFMASALNACGYNDGLAESGPIR
ncbi:MAG TPA: hypothetical protein VGR64_04675, partial [Terracidiphilus sp.]|nr:hypothetical protein [Terracidiphilus sp.]